MDKNIQLKLFATLNKFLPENADRYPISPGITIRDLLHHTGIPEEKAKLIFINGIKADLETTLSGGERVGIFPPVGGG